MFHHLRGGSLGQGHRNKAAEKVHVQAVHKFDLLWRALQTERQTRLFRSLSYDAYSDRHRPFRGWHQQTAARTGRKLNAGSLSDRYLYLLSYLLSIDSIMDLVYLDCAK